MDAFGAPVIRVSHKTPTGGLMDEGAHRQMEGQITAVVLVVLGNGLVKGESGKSRQPEKHPHPTVISV